MFFAKFPNIAYTLTDENGVERTKIATDITTRIVFQKLVESLNVPYLTYDVVDGERPDTVAAKYYGSARQTWIVLLANDMFSDDDWPKTEREFAVYITKVYGSIAAAQSRVYCYRNADGLVIDETTYDSLSSSERTSVSYYDWEVELNEAKRRIKLIPRSEVATVIRQLENVLSEPATRLLV